MAEHTQNAMHDPRASLLVTEPVPDGADPLASGRVTLLGLLTTVPDEARPLARDRYLDANPAAAYYIDFGDFTFYRLDVQSIRYVGGYGRMSWVDPAEYAAAEADPLVSSAAGIIEHMNADHAEAQVLFCRHFAGRPDTTRGDDVGRRPLRLRDDRGERRGSCRGAVGVPEPSARPARRSARQWSPWSARLGARRPEMSRWHAVGRTSVYAHRDRRRS